ncbi:MAG: c-type cytochrome [Candidatus Brocadiae bacterium]|nr:c-type cytochrome [Candidatus Brocadiia bacterium]
MADPLTDHKGTDKVFKDLPVPTFDPVSPGGKRARWALLISSLITIACLLSAMVSEHYLKPWRIYQRQFASLLSANAQKAGKSDPGFQQEIKQIFSTEHKVVDRCTTCHLGIDNPDMANAPQPFRTHPAWVSEVHPLEKLGCTSCHGGQGLATTKEDAHGNVPHWEFPLIPKGYYQAGCGSCHTHLKISGGHLPEQGERIFERNDCFACHTINGRGRGNINLSTIGAKKIPDNWHKKHLILQKSSKDDIWWQSYGSLEEEEISAINAYFSQLVGTPKLVAAKATFFSKGCLGCHRVNGVGGDDGPDLSNAGIKEPITLDFTNVKGNHNLAQWHKEHLQNPSLIVPESQMPKPLLTEAELDAITLFLMSLRGNHQNTKKMPMDRIEALHLHVREFAADGESLYKAFCSSCHGQDRLGNRFGISNISFPSLAHPTFLSLASDRFIRQSLLNGRPGRRMPSWGKKDGGLRTEEIEALIQYLHSDKAAPSWKEVSQGEGDLDSGERMYRNECSACHGAQGEGTLSVPALSNQVFLKTATPEFLYTMLAMGREDTAMGSYRHYNAQEMASLIRYILSWRNGEALPLPSLPESRSIVSGQIAYTESCASCHGSKGEGGIASNLVNPAFLKAASDGFMAAAVKHGRCASSEKKNMLRVTDQDLANIIEYLRKRASLGDQIPPGRLVEGDPKEGEILYDQSCMACHGKKGSKGNAPELSNEVFQNSSTDGYIQATIVRGRLSAGMPGFGMNNINYKKLSMDEVNHIVRYIRTLKNSKE